MAMGMVGFRPTPEDEARLARLHEELQAREPYRKVKISDVLRYAVAAASGSVTPLGTVETVTDSTRTQNGGAK
jgi:hypothetical protein